MMCKISKPLIPGWQKPQSLPCLLPRTVKTLRRTHKDVLTRSRINWSPYVGTSACATGFADTRHGTVLGMLVNCHIKWRLIYILIELQTVDFALRHYDLWWYIHHFRNSEFICAQIYINFKLVQTMYSSLLYFRLTQYWFQGIARSISNGVEQGFEIIPRDTRLSMR